MSIPTTKKHAPIIGSATMYCDFCIDVMLRFRIGSMHLFCIKAIRIRQFRDRNKPGTNSISEHYPYSTATCTFRFPKMPVPEIWEFPPVNATVQQPVGDYCYDYYYDRCNYSNYCFSGFSRKRVFSHFASILFVSSASRRVFLT